MNQIFKYAPLDTKDIIEIVTLLVLAGTLYFIWQQMKTQNAALENQNNVLKAQLLRDSFEMYRNTYTPEEFCLLIDDYMDKSIYESKYKGDNDAIEKYLTLSSRYTYLAFTFKLIDSKLPVPFGPEFAEQWTRDLLKNAEFKDVHNYLKNYYPEIGKFIEKELKKEQ
jgi:hypothetical protein